MEARKTFYSQSKKKFFQTFFLPHALKICLEKNPLYKENVLENLLWE